MGRLAIEKNPGLFLMAAQVLLQRCIFCRFLVIGDGRLRPHLEILAKVLEIEWAVTFTGAVYASLLMILSRLVGDGLIRLD